jgi:hypothetical protein
LLVAIFSVSGMLLATAFLTYLITEGNRKIMADISKLTAAEQDLVAKTDALLAFAATQNTLIAQLQATIANGGIDPTTAAALQALADSMAAESAKVTAFLPPPAP